MINSTNTRKITLKVAHVAPLMGPLRDFKPPMTRQKAIKKAAFWTFSPKIRSASLKMK